MSENTNNLSGLWANETLIYSKGGKVKSSTISKLFYDNLRKSKIYDYDTNDIISNLSDAENVYIDVTKRNLRILDSKADKFSKITKIIKMNTISLVRLTMEGKYVTEVTPYFKFMKKYGHETKPLEAIVISKGDKLKSSNINKLIGNKYNDNKVAMKIKRDYGLNSDFREVLNKEILTLDVEVFNLETETGGFDTLGLYYPEN